MTPQRAAHLVAQVADALDCAHGQKLLHRDVKPANIMLDRQERAILVDFGLVRHGAAMTQSGSILGTLAYMAPEQLGDRAAQAGPSSDLYSLGVTLYHLLTGEPPFQGPLEAVAAQILFQQPEPPRRRRPDLDPHLESICLKAMARLEQDRYPSGAAFAAALRAWLTDPAPSLLIGSGRASPPQPIPAPAATLVKKVARTAPTVDLPTARTSKDHTEERRDPRRIAPSPPLLEVDDGPRPVRKRRGRQLWLGLAVLFAGLTPLEAIWRGKARGRRMTNGLPLSGARVLTRIPTAVTGTNRTP